MPGQVRSAAMLMYAGAVLGAIGPLYYGFTTSASTTPQIWHVGNTTSRAYGAGFVFGAILFAAAIAGLWLWTAWAVRRGRNWARIVSAGFFRPRAPRPLAGFASNPVSVVPPTLALGWLPGPRAVIFLFPRPPHA